MKHYQLCNKLVKHLSSQERKEVADSGKYVSHLTGTQHTRLAKLVGKGALFNVL